eukprot:2396864-Amphidinium_carterae.1
MKSSSPQPGLESWQKSETDAYFTTPKFTCNACWFLASDNHEAIGSPLQCELQHHNEQDSSCVHRVNVWLCITRKVPSNRYEHLQDSL